MPAETGKGESWAVMEDDHGWRLARRVERGSGSGSGSWREEEEEGEAEGEEEAKKGNGKLNKKIIKKFRR